MDIGFPRGLDNLKYRHISAVVAVSDVFTYRCVEQNRFLGDQTDLGSQPVDIQIRRDVLIDQLKEKEK